VARRTIGQRLVALEEVLMSGCPSCRRSEAQAAEVSARLHARISEYFDPERCRAKAAELLAEADRRELLRHGCVPHDRPPWLELEEEEMECRRAESRRSAGPADGQRQRELIDRGESR
jgi:hypothetical protein